MPAGNLTNPRTIRNISPLEESVKFDPKMAGEAIVNGLEYLKNQLDWSGTRIANVLHMPANTVNMWIKKGAVPISSSKLHPEIQIVIHLLAIHRSLEAMFENPIHQRTWLSTHHPELNCIPEELMGKSIEGLIFVRQYLDYVRGRGA